MKFLYPPLSEPLKLSDEYISSLIVENKTVFYRLINDLVNQYNKGNGEAVFSINDKVEDISKKTEVIYQLIPFEINKKSLITKLHNRIKEKALHQEYDSTMRMMSGIEEYLCRMTDLLDFDLELDPIEISGLLKLANIRFAEDTDSLSEKVFQYCREVVNLEGNKAFIIIGIRSFIEDEEFTMLAKTLIDHKITCLFIDSHCEKMIDGEQRVIIDSDRCVI